MKYLHVSKSLMSRGITYINPDRTKAQARSDRRNGFTTARQQRKAAKAWRANEKSEAALQSLIEQNEANFDYQEQERENNEVERELRQEQIYQAHFS